MRGGIAPIPSKLPGNARKSKALYGEKLVNAGGKG
jgi:hypothetical protein